MRRFIIQCVLLFGGIYTRLLIISDATLYLGYCFQKFRKNAVTLYSRAEKFFPDFLILVN